MTFFQTNMLGKNTSPYVLSAMIIGFGLFAKPCKMHMSQDDVKYTFNRILEHTEKILVEYVYYVCFLKNESKFCVANPLYYQIILQFIYL